MTSQQHFSTTVLREFRAALDAAIADDETPPQDCYDPLIQVLGQPLTPAVFYAADPATIEQLRLAFNAWFEIDNVRSADVERAIKAVQFHWPLET